MLPPVTGLSVVTVTETVVSITWVAVETNLKGYQVWLTADGSEPIISTSILELELDFDFTDLIPGTEYCVHVVALNAALRPSKATSLTCTTLPTPPVDLAITSVDEHSLTAEWCPPASGRADKYRVWLTDYEEALISEDLTESTCTGTCTLHSCQSRWIS